jgi:hypothetical protein
MANLIVKNIEKEKFLGQATAPAGSGRHGGRPYLLKTNMLFMAKLMHSRADT